MKKALVFFVAAIIFSYPLFAQNKNCNLAANDLVRLVRADQKTTDNILLHHCFIVDSTVSNGALANYRRDYTEDKQSFHDKLFTVTAGTITIITNAASTYYLYIAELKKKGFRFVRKDEYGARYVYDKYVLYANDNKNPLNDGEYSLIIDKE